MIDVVVFTGPTLPASQAREILAADYRAPAKAGDILEAVLSHPKAIGLIDGVFESVPSVWHKEILFALSQGIHVYGASSMGALRAAELHQFGMIGVGRIFEAYRDGVLEDDDEVALVHGPLDEGSGVQSEAMVNVRESLRVAREESVITTDIHDRLIAIAKSIYFADRSWTAILRRAAEAGIDSANIAVLQQFVRQIPVNLKQRDAMLLLQRISADVLSGLKAHQPAFTFEWTTFFEDLRNAGRPALEKAPNGGPGDLWRSLRGPVIKHRQRNELLLSLAIAEGQRRGRSVTADQLREHARRFFAERRLRSEQEIESWLSENHLSLDDFRYLIRLDAWAEALSADCDQNP